MKHGSKFRFADKSDDFAMQKLETLRAIKKLMV